VKLRLDIREWDEGETTKDGKSIIFAHVVAATDWPGNSFTTRANSKPIMGKELIRISLGLLAIRLERGMSAVPTPTNVIVVEHDIEETILTTHLRLVLSGSALGRSLRAGRSIVTHLAAAVADDAQIGKRVLRVLHFDVIEFFLGDLGLLAVR